MLDNKDGGGIGSGNEARVVELTRKVAVFEVNEAMLSRRYIAQAEQLKIESEAKNRIEADFVEMEVIPDFVMIIPDNCFHITIGVLFLYAEHVEA
jgi:hypothetical protein